MPWDPKVQNVRVPTKRSILKDEVLKGLRIGTIVLSDVAATIPGVDEANVYQYALECVWAVLEENLAASKFVVAMKAIGEVTGIPEVLANVFWCVWADLEGPAKCFYTEESQKQEVEAKSVAHLAQDPSIALLVDLLRTCRQEGIASDAALIVSLDHRLLLLANVVLEGKKGAKGGPNNFTARQSTTRYARRVKVNRYSMFREETEGYAKLLTLLNNRDLVLSRPPEELAAGVHELIGYFSLHVAKVAICALHAIEANPLSADVRPCHRAPFA